MERRVLLAMQLGRAMTPDRREVIEESDMRPEHPIDAEPLTPREVYDLGMRLRRGNPVTHKAVLRLWATADSAQARLDAVDLGPKVIRADRDLSGAITFVVVEDGETQLGIPVGNGESHKEKTAQDVANDYLHAHAEQRGDSAFHLGVFGHVDEIRVGDVFRVMRVHTDPTETSVRLERIEGVTS